MEGKKSNKISDIVRLQRILKKWKKLAINNNTPKTTTTTNKNNNKGIKLLKKTLSFSDNASSCATVSATDNNSNNNYVPKGYLAVCVGKQLKRFVIPTEYLTHPGFRILLREAEEEFGFHHEGVLKFPCDVVVFERILKLVQENKDFNNNNNSVFVDDDLLFNSGDFDVVSNLSASCSPDYDQGFQSSSHPQLCR